MNKEEKQLTNASASVRLYHNGRFIVGSWPAPKALSMRINFSS